ncbi:unnamed protein product [Rotaria sordida]|uniref:Uncharacterized protein n=1 Tax=Rotaria sordida TaxID=392033 RepID=A0A818T9L2_9BILA|nr:unnamed protein product [Rotaria sordida]CAF1129961.1 unnamed protein product [Rotaria sordida]CAF3678766.1 unnamed protein product [Rotaria sordida]CAF3691120.1 unnamed protein product [Rotaria sordida]
MLSWWLKYTSKDHCALQYSCLCQYLIKQNSTAIDIQSLSTKSDEKEILILSFIVFKVIAIKRNYLDDPTASISIEIELEECEGPNDNQNEAEKHVNSFMNQQDCITQIKAIQDYQMNIQYWSGIGLNFFLCNENDDQKQIYEGRGWKNIGAYCLGYNFNSLDKNRFLV